MDTSLETEATLGDRSFQEVMQQYHGQILPSSHPDARFVQSVVDRIVRSNALEPPGKSGWQTFVIRDDTKNAFVTPGGHIFVFTGILPVAKDADGLAVILGHGEWRGRGAAAGWAEADGGLRVCRDCASGGEAQCGAVLVHEGEQQPRLRCFPRPGLTVCSPVAGQVLFGLGLILDSLGIVSTRHVSIPCLRLSADSCHRRTSASAKSCSTCS